MDEEAFFSQGRGPINKDIFKPNSNWLFKHWVYIQFWDSLLKQKYFQTRHKLQKFAEKTHTQVKGVDLIIKGKQALFQFIKKYKNDEWIMLPTDDDDFFNPGLVDKVLGHFDADIIHWNTLCFDTTQPRLGMHVEQMKNNIFPSNSYAITNKLSKLPGPLLEEMISRHCIVRNYTQQFLLVHQHAKANLSIYNKNPLSFSSTRVKTMVKSKINNYFEAIGKSLQGDVECDFPWATPYLVKIKNILQECFN